MKDCDVRQRVLAIKACIKLIGSELTTLSLQGKANVNSLTIKEVGKQCPNLTYLDLNCSKRTSMWPTRT